MGTDFYHPGNEDMDERRDNGNRKTVAEAVEAIDRRTERLDDFLFGKPGQEYNGWVARTDRRLDELDNPREGRVKKVETKIVWWMGAMSIIGPLAALFINYLLRA